MVDQTGIELSQSIFNVLGGEQTERDRYGIFIAYYYRPYLWCCSVGYIVLHRLDYRPFRYAYHIGAAVYSGHFTTTRLTGRKLYYMLCLGGSFLFDIHYFIPVAADSRSVFKI